MDNPFIAILRQALDLPRGKFYLPDGLAPVDAYSPYQPYDRLLMVLDGEKHEPMSLNGKLETVILKPGDAWLIRKYTWEYVSFTHAHRLLCIVLRGQYLRLSCYDIQANTPYKPWPKAIEYHTPHPPGTALTSTIGALADPAAAAGNHTEHLAKAILSLTLDECLKSAEPASKSLATFDRVRSHIERNFNYELSREDIAEHFDLNPSYLSQLFKKMSGHTLQDYILECRINMAKTLLRNTTLTMKEIAVRCGFSGEVYFVRRFRESTGLPPGRFRRKFEQ